jgi:aminopeptidase N
MRTHINDIETVPLVGQYGVNDSYSGNIYYKGSTVLHTLRQLVNSDEKWRSILRGLNKEFYHQTVTTEQIESYIARESGLNLDAFFDQYLRDTRTPTLSYKLDKKNVLQFKWESCIPTFDMPIKIKFEDTILWIKPSTSWSSIKLNSKETIKDIVVDKSFYVNTQIVN